MTVLFGVLLWRVFYLQIIKGEEYQDNYTLKIVKERTLNSTRGNIYDRNGELLVRSIASYDLMAIPRDVGEFDTLALARIAGVTPEKLKSELDKAARYSRRRPSVIVKQMSLEAKLLFRRRRILRFLYRLPDHALYPRKMAGEPRSVISARWTRRR